MAYTQTDWNNEASPPISAENLDKMESGIAAGVGYSTKTSVKAISATEYGHTTRINYDGSFWNYEATSTYSEDGGSFAGTVIEPDSGTGRWIRNYSAKRVEWFGDDSGAVTAATSEGGDIVVNSEINLDSVIQISSSNTKLSFAKDAFLNPSALTAGIQVFGSEPSTFTNLSSDLDEGDNSASVTSVGGISVGDWVEIRSDAELEDTITVTNYYGWLAKVIGISGTTITFDCNVPYSFLTSDSAKLGVADVIENVTIDCATINKEDYTQLIQTGISLKYCADVEIISPTIYGSKIASAVEDETADAGLSAISIYNCVNVTVSNIKLSNIAWYGVGVSGACRNVTVNGGYSSDVRHTVSVVFNSGGYGEPYNVKFNKITSQNTTKTGFDTHDSGKDIHFNDCTAIGARSGYSGFNIRSPDVTITNPISHSNNLDGIATATNGRGLRVINPTCYNNGRYGVGVDDFGGYIEGGKISTSGATAIGISSGVVTGTIIDATDAGYPIRLFAGDDNNTDSLSISNIFVERGGLTGNVFMLGQNDGTNNPLFSKVTITGSYIPDYMTSGSGSTPFFISGGDSGDLAPAITNCTLSSDRAKVRGRVSLVAGTVTITNDEVINRSSSPAYTSRVQIRSTSGTSVGALSWKRSGGGIVVTSTDSGDTSEIEWWVDG